jgi:hypothetical protein
VTDEAEQRRRKKRLMAIAVGVFRVAILAAVAACVVHTVVKSVGQFREAEFSLADVDYRWLAAACGLYLAGLAMSWLFWHRVLVAMGQRPTMWQSLRAFYLSQLGKYVPGKAMVVVLRTDAVRSDRVDTTVAATSVFVETLTAMAVGSLTAAVLLSVLFAHETYLLLLSLGLMLCAGVPVLPPVFRRLVRIVGVRRANPAIDEALAGLNWRVMFFGWAATSIGWWIYGASLWATLRAMPGVEVDAGHWPLVTACVSLAVVAGFVSMLPGGVGVRELVVMTLLAPAFGQVPAILSAVLLRLVWLVSEAVVSIILYPMGRARRPNDDSPSPRPAN